MISSNIFRPARPSASPAQEQSSGMRKKDCERRKKHNKSCLLLSLGDGGEDKRREEAAGNFSSHFRSEPRGALIKTLWALPLDII